MIIALDVGNSFLKWKIATDKGLSLERGCCEFDKAAAELLALQDHHFDLAIFSNVSRHDVPKQLQHVIKAKRWHQLTSEQSLLGVTNAYMKPEMLGVDRWLVAVEAYNRSDKQAVMVIDAGTAITLDVVDVEGLHQGGFIIPSAYLMQESLLQRTAKIKVEEDDCPNEYGKNTSCAVKAGLKRVLAAWISFEVKEFKANFPQGRVFLTGGAKLDHDLSLNSLDDIVFEEDLLLDGLIRAGRELE